MGLSLALVGSGCTFDRLVDGNGPKPLSAYLDGLPSASEGQLAEWKDMIVGGTFFGQEKAMPGVGAFEGYKRSFDTSFLWFILVGPGHEWSYLEPSSADAAASSTFVQADDYWGILAFQYCRFKSRVYDEQTGLCVKKVKATIVGWFFSHTSLI